MSMHVLKYCYAAQDALLEDVSGCPIWPVSNHAALSSLLKACAFLGIGAEKAEEARVSTGALFRRSTVAAFRLLDEGPARLYAHLTGRVFLSLQSIDEVRCLDNLGVLLTTSDQLSLELIETMFSERLFVPGLLFASDVSALYQVALRFSIGSLVSFPLQSRQLVFTPSPYISEIWSETFDLVSDLMGAGDDVRLALNAGNDVLAVNAKSDGVDLLLNSSVICPFRHNLSADSRGRRGRPLCLELGRCTRFPDLPTIKEAHSDWPLIHASDISAKILLLHTCRGLRVVDESFDPTFGLATALLENSQTACIVTTWSMAEEGKIEWLKYAVERLEQGANIGQVVSEINANHDGSMITSGLLVLGDPEVRCNLKTDEARPDTGSVTRNKFGAQSRISRPSLAEFLLSGLRWSYDFNPYCNDEATLRAIRTMEGLTANEGARQDVDCTETLDAFSRVVELDDAWTSIQSNVRHVGRGIRCQACGGQSQLNRYEYLVPGTDRYSLSCPRCGVVVNSSVGRAPKLHRPSGSSNRLQLIGVPAEARAVVTMVSRHFPFSQHFRWPTDEQGMRAIEFEIPDRSQLPVGPLQCRVLVGWNLNIAAVATRIEGASGDK
jgi:hypothetical protein